MQPFLGIPLSPCLICGIIQDIKNIHISRDIHFKAFFFFFFLAVCSIECFSSVFLSRDRSITWANLVSQTSREFPRRF